MIRRTASCAVVAAPRRLRPRAISGCAVSQASGFALDFPRATISPCTTANRHNGLSVRVPSCSLSFPNGHGGKTNGNSVPRQEQHWLRWASNRHFSSNALAPVGEDGVGPAGEGNAAVADGQEGEESTRAEGSMMEASDASDGASPSHTVVEHPPAPGWVYPPVPEGCEPKFAVIRLGNTQHKVTKDDVIVAEKIRGDIGTTVDITDVLLVGTRDETIVGRPMIAGASVKLFVEEQAKDEKVIVFKKRRRKSSKTTKGHRRQVTLLRVMDISP